MAKLNLTETRAVRRGETILRDYRHKETDEVCWVEVKLTWGELRYRVYEMTAWHKTPGEALRAYEVAVILNAELAIVAV